MDKDITSISLLENLKICISNKRKIPEFQNLKKKNRKNNFANIYENNESKLFHIIQ